jgi:hypothetical protein
MPILNDIMDNKVFGPVIRQSREEGKQEGLQEGLQEGRHQMVQRLLEKRFGPMPEWLRKRLVSLPADDLDDVAVRLLDASSLEDLFPSKQ